MNRAQFLAEIETRSERLPFSGCWIWMRGSSAGRYGALDFEGKITTPHRVAYSLLVGPLISGLCVCHSCDVGFCVNPDHLFQGTQSDNLRDMARKGHSPKVKLSIEDLQAIIASKASHTETARKYGVSLGHISQIRAGLYRGRINPD